MQEAEYRTTIADESSSEVIGVVIIGRNEGERLKRCVASVRPARHVVYVDSDSSDGSAQWARQEQISVVALDLSKPFTAARARNEGARALRLVAPGVAFVQFVDGDCELAPDWLSMARDFLSAHEQCAAVCGRLRERFPDSSLYNGLCDQEWDVPTGKAKACGGIAMMRMAAFEAAGGFREDLIAGEEPELCVRLRATGWEIWRVSDEMAWHDAAMTRFAQWWKRARRGGHAFAEGAWLHGTGPERHYVAETRRALLWGAVLPVAAVSMALLFNAGWLLLLLLYPIQVLRLALRGGVSNRAARWRALFLVLARFPESQGVLTFWMNLLRRRRSGLIEYK